MEIEIDAAEGARMVALAQDHRNVFIKGNAVAQMRPAAFVGLDRFAEQGHQSGLKIFRGFINADDVLVVHLHRFQQFVAERFYRHDGQSSNSPPKSEGKKVRRQTRRSCPGTDRAHNFRRAVPARRLE